MTVKEFTVKIFVRKIPCSPCISEIRDFSNSINSRTLTECYVKVVLQAVWMIQDKFFRCLWYQLQSKSKSGRIAGRFNPQMIFILLI